MFIFLMLSLNLICSKFSLDLFSLIFVKLVIHGLIILVLTIRFWRRCLFLLLVCHLWLLNLLHVHVLFLLLLFLGLVFLIIFRRIELLLNHLRHLEKRIRPVDVKLGLLLLLRFSLIVSVLLFILVHVFFHARLLHV